MNCLNNYTTLENASVYEPAKRLTSTTDEAADSFYMNHLELTGVSADYSEQSVAMSQASTVDGEVDTLFDLTGEILSEKRVSTLAIEKSIRRRPQPNENLKSKRWSASEEAAFWELLHEFGTNFDFIAARMPHKNRKQVLLKFAREDKKNPSRIDATLKR